MYFKDLFEKKNYLKIRMKSAPNFLQKKNKFSLREKLREFKTAFRHKNLKYLTYNSQIDFEYNEKLLTNLGYDLEATKQILSSENLDYFDKELSWHYHIFSALSKKKEKLRLLEIGTGIGNFTNFLSKIFKDSEIITVDLPHNDPNFINQRHSKENLDTTNSRKEEFFFNKEKIISMNTKKQNEFIFKREQNLRNDNIRLYEIDSFHIIDKFEKNSFDLIWVDGDHLNPQATIDISNSFHLLKQNGIMLCDDILKKEKNSKYSSNETFFSLISLENKNLIKNKFLIKRCWKINAIRKKYISITSKN
jgi:predicted O-methyltransferase YrrM